MNIRPVSQKVTGFLVGGVMEDLACILRIKGRIVTYISSKQEACSQSDIYRDVVGRRSDIAKALATLVGENFLNCIGDGVRSDPRKYSLSQKNCNRALPPKGTDIEREIAREDTTARVEVLI